MNEQNYDLLTRQIERAEKIFRQVKCPYTASFEPIYWAKYENHWRIMFDDKPLMCAPVADRIDCAHMIPGLYDELIKSKADAQTDAGKEASKLQLVLDYIEKEI